MSHPAPEVADLGNGYSLLWPEQRVRFLVEYITRQSAGIYAEFTVINGDKVLCEGQRVNLNGDKSRLAKKVQEVDGHSKLGDWTLLIEATAVLVLRRYREGEPPHRLNADTPVEDLSYQVNPLVHPRKVSILYGDGGLGKSSLALFIGMLVATGASVAGLSAVRGRVLFLDYEDTLDVHARRRRAIAECHPTLKVAEIIYQTHHEPIWNILPTLMRLVQLERIEFIILDSLAAATCGDASAEAATKAFRALRMLNRGALVLAHIPKTNEQQQEAGIYGSVFYKNFARSTWELKKEQEVGADESVLGLFNRKSNLSRLHAPIGLRVRQNSTNTAMSYEACDLSRTVELAKGLPVASRIRDFLENDGNLHAAKDIAEALEIPVGTIKTTLSRHNRIKWNSVGEGREAKWCVLNR
ncbi:MAG: AAA family ATPase [Nitrospirae bacterium]|nr:AAA family ATPase [Nitrospirota bacterium]